MNLFGYRLHVVSVTFKVMAHPSREAWAYHIANAVDGVIVWDEIGQAWDTGKRALLDGAEEADQVCVLQDDTILSDNLREVVTEMVQHSGEHPIGLYAGRSQQASAALELGADPWYQATGPIWGPGVVIPSIHVVELVKVGQRFTGPSYDQRLWRYFQRVEVLCYYPVPSVVQHRTNHESLMNRRKGPRQAQVFGSGVGKDWSVEPPVYDRHQLHPRVNVWNGNRRRPVRKHSKQWRDAIAAGWVER